MTSRATWSPMARRRQLGTSGPRVVRCIAENRTSDLRHRRLSGSRRYTRTRRSHVVETRDRRFGPGTSVDSRQRRADRCVDCFHFLHDENIRLQRRNPLCLRPKSANATVPCNQAHLVQIVPRFTEVADHHIVAKTRSARRHCQGPQAARMRGRRVATSLAQCRAQIQHRMRDGQRTCR
jgi:hypothetical protein